MSDLDDIIDGLRHVVGVAMRGDDKYKRWPLPEMCSALNALEILRDEKLLRGPK